MSDVGSVGLLELTTHENFLIDLVKVARHAGYEVTVFTSEKIFDRVADAFQSGEIQWTVRDKDESLAAYLTRVETRCTDLDLLYCFPPAGTFIDFARYARFNPPCPFVVSVYNVHNWTAMQLRLTPRVDRYLRLLLRRRILDRCDAISVEYDPIKRYLSDLTGVPVHTMTPVVFDCATSPPDDGPVTVTIPGMIDQTRRDYDVVFDALSRLDVKPADISLHLLGRPVGDGGERIASRAEAAADKGWNVRYHDEWIDTVEFNDMLRNSDVLLSPLRETKAQDVAFEVYGTSKASGVVGDAIRHGKPLVLPDSYQVPARMADATRTYASVADLASMIERLTGDVERDELASAALDTARVYSLDRQAERFTALASAVTDV